MASHSKKSLNQLSLEVQVFKDQLQSESERLGHFASSIQRNILFCTQNLENLQSLKRRHEVLCEANSRKQTILEHLNEEIEFAKSDIQKLDE